MMSKSKNGVLELRTGGQVRLDIFIPLKTDLDYHLRRYGLSLRTKFSK